MQKSVLIILLLCLFSCTVEKRLYLPGYSIQWKKNKGKLQSDAAVIRLEEENNPITVSEKAEINQEEQSGLNPIGLDSVEEQEFTGSKTTTESFKRKAFPKQTVQKTIQPKSRIKNAVNDDPEEERSPRYPNGFMQVLAVFLGIICGIVAGVFAILLILFANDFSAFDSNGNNSGSQKTFKSVFLAAFRITFVLVTALLIITILVFLAIYLFQTYGALVLILTIIGIILLLLLLSYLFSKAFDFVFHDR